MRGKERVSFIKHPEKIIMRTISKFINENPANLRKADGGKYWDTPLVGFSSGENPLFKDYKKIIGKFHVTPHDIFTSTFNKDIPSKELSVISWILPASEDVRKSNRTKTKFPSLSWAHTRVFRGRIQYKTKKSFGFIFKEKGIQSGGSP